MATRRPNILRGAIELGFAALALIAGRLGAPLWGLALIALASVAYWALSRRAALSRMQGGQLYAQGGIAIALLIAVLSAAFWIGRAWRDLG